ncbi:uncharacterized protein LAJ45_06796 [Morchella importuna]|uniref:Defect at low temperature protein 1 n=1 Tax=Morchella conica CCBAS932 TaxID=1392247 RepID=A0A3N4KFT9_9PEZI|nr:uncharacterized protein LAJ45_06796 [Morchella importuna]KAH8149256.1 hypothetical protein LAJ45_06796 [Morchella importuna]RPB09403.1 hypothetical protein P167DRAFT_577252 [Morchella conica CCBAS932]
MALHRLHRFFYSTSFTILFLFLFLLLLITPADAIVQAYFRNSQLYNIFIIAGTYVLTALLALAIYISRIYSVRRLMEEIPKSWAPVKKMDLPKRVHKAIAGNLGRSAIIAVQSRPNPSTVSGTGGVISHPGWSAPSSVDLPEVHYLSVIAELPHLIEAKALSLRLGGQDLRRQPHMTLRAYLSHLAVFGVVKGGAADLFLGGYERARFRTRSAGVEEEEFRGLMKVFAGLLRGMGEHAPPSIHTQEEDLSGWITHDEDEDDDRHGGSGVAEEEYGYSEGEGSVLRRGPYMSLGYETTTTDYGDEEEEEGLRYTPDPHSGGQHSYFDRPRTKEEHDLYLEQERQKIKSSLGRTRMQRARTSSSLGSTTSAGTKDGEGYEMVSLSPESDRARAQRLSVRVSTGTFG